MPKKRARLKNKAKEPSDALQEIAVLRAIEILKGEGYEVEFTPEGEEPPGS